jgi:transcriptional regulator with XRE-family HTH domain
MQAKNKRLIRIKQEEATREITNEAKRLRKALGLTQKIFAERIGVNIREYQRFEEGFFNPYTFLKLLKSLNLFPFKLPTILKSK